MGRCQVTFEEVGRSLKRMVVVVGAEVSLSVFMWRVGWLRRCVMVHTKCPYSAGSGAWD